MASEESVKVFHKYISSYVSKTINKNYGSIAFYKINSILNNGDTEVLINAVRDKCRSSIYHNYRISCKYNVNYRTKNSIFPLIEYIHSYYFIRGLKLIKCNEVLIVYLPIEKAKSWTNNDCI